ncbi:MAG: methyl-accepting chemotaxis protein [Candidatus Omnitrophota bacterium]
MGKANNRSRYFIDRKFQAKFILRFCAIVIAASIIIGIVLFILLRNSTTVAIENTRVTVKTTSDFILPVIVQTVIIVTIFSAASVIAFVLFMSHKIAGPLYRFKNEIERIAQGNLNVNFNIRTDDQLKSLSDSLSKMGDFLRGKIKMLKEELSQADSSPEKISLNSQLFAEKLKRIKDIVNSFNI